MLLRYGTRHGGDGTAVKASIDFNHPGAISALSVAIIEGHTWPLSGSQPLIRGDGAPTTINCGYPVGAERRMRGAKQVVTGKKGAVGRLIGNQMHCGKCFRSLRLD